MKAHAMAFLMLFPALSVAAEPPRVLTDIPPVHSLTARVMQGVGAPDLLLSGQVSAHDYALKPSDAGRIADAELIVWVGHGLTPWLEDSLGALSGDAVTLELLETPGTLHRPRRDNPIFDDEAEEGHEHEHDHGLDDPHGWLDPANAIVWTDAIATTLGEVDPDNAEAYRLNAVAAMAELTGVMEALDDRLEGSDPAFILSHDAFVHFESRFGVRAVGAIANTDAEIPGPRRIAQLREVLEGGGVACLLYEIGTANAGLRALAEGGDIALVEIDPLGVTFPPGPELYGQLMSALGDDLTGCARK